MKKAFVLTVLALLIVSSIGFASAKTLIAGKIYNADYTDTVAGATVEVTCNGNLKTTTSLSDGAYAVTYCESLTGCSEDVTCNNGDSLSVYAEKGGLTGTKDGVINDDVIDEWDVAVVNVPLIPEFGLAVGALTMLGAVIAFFIIRRN